jgi:signal transduction histidine kinase
MAKRENDPKDAPTTRGMRTPARADLTAAMTATLAVMRGEVLEGHFDLGERLLIGRGVHCQVVIEDEGISRSHLQIERGEERLTFFAVDQDSTNGSFLNGRPLAPHAPTRLHHGDRLSVGSRTIHYIVETPTQHALRESFVSTSAARDAHARLRQHRETLTAFVIHDLKSPLSAIQINSRYLLDFGGLGGESKSIVEDVMGASLTMNQRLLDLLDLSRKEIEGVVLKLAPVDLTALAEEVVRQLKRVATDAAQALVFSPGPALSITGDAQLLSRLLENLIGNAIKYSPPGGAVTVAVERQDGVACLTVRDLGKGVPAGERTRIFEEFQRLGEPAQVGEQGSHGLGLAFCRLVAQAHGGDIEVEDNLPRGSCFRVRLQKPVAG